MSDESPLPDVLWWNPPTTPASGPWTAVRSVDQLDPMAPTPGVWWSTAPCLTAEDAVDRATAAQALAEGVVVLDVRAPWGPLSSVEGTLEAARALGQAGTRFVAVTHDDPVLAEALRHAGAVGLIVRRPARPGWLAHLAATGPTWLALGLGERLPLAVPGLRPAWADRPAWWRPAV